MAESGAPTPSANTGAAAQRKLPSGEHGETYCERCKLDLRTRCLRPSGRLDWVCIRCDFPDRYDLKRLAEKDTPD